MTIPPAIERAIADARALQAEVEQGTATNVLTRARAALAAIDDWCNGPAAAERSHAVIAALEEQKVSVLW